MKKTWIADIWLRDHLHGKEPSKKRLSLTDVFRVPVISFESRNILVT
jgi:hypothetical protein